MKNIYWYFFCVVCMCGTADAAPQSTTCVIRNVFTSCNAGYYLSSGNCIACAKGTYKSGSGTATSCSSCLSPGTTAGTGATAITDCYIPKDTVGSDSAGTYKYTADCPYKT